jgi:uncharacterized protein (DUF433 family)
MTLRIFPSALQVAARMRWKTHREHALAAIVTRDRDHGRRRAAGGVRRHRGADLTLRGLRARRAPVLVIARGKLWSMSFTRITVRADQMGGVPCIRGLRIPVATVVGMVAEGMSDQEILAAYPDLEVEDIREAVRYAAEAVRERELPLVATG